MLVVGDGVEERSQVRGAGRQNHPGEWIGIKLSKQTLGIFWIGDPMQLNLLHSHCHGDYSLGK